MTWADPADVVECLVRGLWWSLTVVGFSALLVGSLSAFAPQRSIALYQRIMACFNWRVEPIDPAHELRTTRFLGILLVGLSVILTWFLLKNGDVSLFP